MKFGHIQFQNGGAFHFFRSQSQNFGSSNYVVYQLCTFMVNRTFVLGPFLVGVGGQLLDLFSLARAGAQQIAGLPRNPRQPRLKKTT